VKRINICIVLFLIVAMFLTGCTTDGIAPSVPDDEEDTPVDTPINHEPVINSNPDTSAIIGQLYNYDVNANDPDEDTLTYSLDTSPSGMSINSFSGLISWTPEYDGDFNVVVKVSDGELFDSQSFVITVNQVVSTNQLPFANFTSYPTSGYAPLEVFFDGSNSYDLDGNIVTYTWDFKDGNTGYGQIVNHTFNSVGTYNVKLTVTDNSGESDSTTKAIIVTEYSSPPTGSNDLDYLEGSIIIANDSQYLGKISKNQFDADSINNSYGTYGSEYSMYSIFNNYGTYGSQYSSLSPFNKYTSTPPKIYKNDIFIAYLTVNTIMYPRVDTNLLVAWLNE
jgi:PKD repeat protein